MTTTHKVTAIGGMENIHQLVAHPVDSEQIAVPKLRRLEGEARMLAALLQAGVENWSGYALALDIYRADGIGEEE